MARGELTAAAGRLGTHHFAHLRAVAEGVDVVDAARRYLAVQHGAEALTAHRLVVERVRAVARRRGDSRWRLIGMEIREHATSAGALPPPLYEWAEAKGYTAWSEDDLRGMYAEAFPEAGPTEASARRRQARNARLREQRLAVLRDLEATASQQPLPSDLLDGWLPADLAEQLRKLGALTLADLQARIARGGRWWVGLRAFGPIKAARLAAHVKVLLGTPPAQRLALPVAPATLAKLSGRDGSNRARGAVAGLTAQNDREAVQAWVAARAGSPLTAKQYEREAERFMLWCVIERGKALSDATAEDCRAFMDFLANIPAAWISRRKVPRLAPGWTPFRGCLSIASQQLAVTILHSLCEWLVQARYLASNPWVLVNKRLGDDPSRARTGRAFTPAAWSALQAYLDISPLSPSTARLRWICTFVEATGLRASELLRAQIGHLERTQLGWILHVHGKGRRLRSIPVPAGAVRATELYLASRDIALGTSAPPTPLLSSLTQPDQPLSYRALHQSFTAFVRRALATSSLPQAEREQAAAAALHWLRHTHATRAAERGVPPDVLQENLGHADPRQTAHYYRAQIERRQREMERAFPR